MLLFAVLIHTLHAALEDRKVAFDRIGVHVAAHVFVVRVGDGFMGREFFADAHVEAAFVSMQARFAGDIVSHDLVDAFAVGISGIERAHSAAAFQQRHNRTLAGGAGFAALSVRGGALARRSPFLLLAKVSFVGLDDCAIATER